MSTLQLPIPSGASEACALRGTPWPASLLRDPELAAARMRQLLAVYGVGQ